MLICHCDFYLIIIFWFYSLLPSLVWCAPAGNDTERIYNGEFASDGQFPFMAFVQSRSNHFCGGTIINDDTILTAAHCVFCNEEDNNGNGWYTITIGKVKPFEGDQSTGHYESRTCRRHESFNDNNIMSGNDVAVIKLKQKIKFGSGAHVGKVCIVSEHSRVADTSACQIVGWGQSNRPNKRVQHLEFADIHLQTRDTCKGRYNDQLLLCAGGDPSGKDTCFGDSGGPLICRPKGSKSVDSEWLQFGITSYGVSNDCGRLPTFYTRVAHHNEWIKKQAEMK